MKKFISIVAATAIAATSIVASAAKYENIGKIPNPNNDVPVKLDITSSTGRVYGNHATESNALASTSSPMTVNAKATLDMKNVAEEWNAYYEAALGSGASEESAKATMNAADISGEFTIIITGDEYVSNEALAAANVENPAWTWDEKTAELFTTKSASYDAATNTFTLVMAVNAKGEAFTDYISSTPTLTIDGTKITAKDTLTTDGEYHSVTGKFSGSVDISIPLGKYKISFKSEDDTEWFKLYKSSSRGGGGGGVRTTPTPAPTATADPNATDAPETTDTPNVTPVPNPQVPVTETGAALNYEEHYAYIIGYPTEGGELTDVRPQANISRAEVATIFFRLLTDESRSRFWTQDNNFSDVSVEDWFNNAISTAAAAGIISGYEDGTFKPNEPISRAEFATIAARFSSLEDGGHTYFGDIDGHWAEKYINRAAAANWITGYGDEFRPDQKITRAEAVTIINRVLSRIVSTASLSDDMVKFADNLDTTAWYYADMQEAANSHTYEREALGHVETWASVVEPRDWEALEKEDSTAASAGTEDALAAEQKAVEDAAAEDAKDAEVEDEDAEADDTEDADDAEDEDAEAEGTDADAEDAEAAE